jgi:hypothetical protein
MLSFAQFLLLSHFVEKSEHFAYTQQPLQFYPERECELGMGKAYTQFYRKWSEVKNKLY